MREHRSVNETVMEVVALHWCLCYQNMKDFKDNNKKGKVLK